MKLISAAQRIKLRDALIGRPWSEARRKAQRPKAVHACPPTLARLHALLEYDPGAGLFRWRSPSKKQPTGWFKGNKSVRQYRRLYLDGHHYMAHQIAWALMTGTWAKELDHRDRDQANNVWSNLRSVTHAENMQNRGPK